MEATRICKRCAKLKVLSDFPPDWNSSSRKSPKKASYCKQCMREYQREKYGKRKDRVYWTKSDKERYKRYKEEAILRMGGKCQDCGGVYPTVVYDFHHLDPEEKEYSPASTFQKKWETVEKEVIGKCVLLCANCHRLRHWSIPTFETTEQQSEGT